MLASSIVCPMACLLLLRPVLVFASGKKLWARSLWSHPGAPHSTLGPKGRGGGGGCCHLPSLLPHTCPRLCCPRQQLPKKIKKLLKIKIYGESNFTWGYQPTFSLCANIWYELRWKPEECHISSLVLKTKQIKKQQ